MSPDWLSAIGTILAVVVALFIALFQEHVQRWMFKPKLSALATDKSPYCLRNTYFLEGTTTIHRPHYSLRIAIENHGNTEARSVEVFVSDMRRQKGRGEFEPVIGFIGTYLVWSDFEGQVLDVLNPEMPKYCYLGRVFWKENLPDSFHSGIGEPTEDFLGDRTVLDLPPPPGSSRRQRYPPGNYRLTVRVGALNAKPIEKVIKIYLTGRWIEDQVGVIERVNEILDFGIEDS